MLTINAGKHPLMQRLYKPEDEKRPPLVVPHETGHQAYLRVKTEAEDLIVQAVMQSA